MNNIPSSMFSYRSEQQFFDDPVLDRLMAVTMTLAAEVYMLRERVESLENGGHSSTESSATQRDRNAEADLFVHHLLSPLLGEQQSRGPK